MKILIAYYSRTGGTEKLAEALRKELETRGHSVDTEKVQPLKEHSFLGWFLIRMVKGDSAIQEPKIKDVSKYDAILIGSPNWTRLSLPVAGYLRLIEGLKNKKIGFFATTGLPDILVWLVFSAFLLDLTFSNLIAKKGGRIIASILLSSIFKKWGFESEYGKKVIKNFCSKIETPIRSLKDYFLEQKEVSDNRTLLITLSLIFLFFLVFQIFSSVFPIQLLTFKEVLSLFVIGFFIYLILLLILAGRIWLFLGKYVISFSLVAIITILISFLSLVHGRSIIIGYILISSLISLFRDLRAVLFTGLVSILSYLFLFFTSPQQEILTPFLDLPLFFLSISVISLVTQNLQKHFIDLLEAQDEIEITRAALEIKVTARTRELKELAESLEKRVKEKTKELQEKIEELERFNRLAVGRELRMVELKEEIKKIKEELGKGRKIKNN